jgi:predicted permease
MSALSFSSITYVTFEAVFEVVIICFAGFVLAHSGLLGNTGQKLISQLNVDVFTPCLVFAKLAPSLSFKKMADLIVIPIFYAFATGTSYVCSVFISKVLHLNGPESDFVTAMAVFGNSNSLPVSLTLSLAYSLPNLMWSDIDDDSADKVASRGILYLLIFQQLGQILRWSWGFNSLLKKRPLYELNYYGPDIRVLDDEQSPLLPHKNDSPGKVVVQSHRHNNDDNDNNDNDNDSKDPVISIAIEQYSPSALDTICRLPGIKHFLAYMNPPLYAMLFSVLVASTPLQQMFFSGGFVTNTLTKSVVQLGGVSVPLTLIVLGSNLYPTSGIPPASKHYNRVIIGSLLSRMILPSIILLPVIAMCVKYVNVSILDDPIFLIVAFILTISPPAIQLSQITQINGIYQKEMSGVLFWGYVILTLPTTIFIVVASLEVLKWAL